MDLAPGALTSSALHPVWLLDVGEESGLHLDGVPEPVAIPTRSARVWMNET